VTGSDRLGRHAGVLWFTVVSWTAGLCVCVRAVLEAAESDNLVPGPDSDGEGAGAVAVHSDKGCAEEIIRQLRWQLAACVVFAR
jgi:hypothetical protein